MKTELEALPQNNCLLEGGETSLNKKLELSVDLI